MEGDDIYEIIRYFGEQKKILYVHFRNVSGQVPKFHEEFVNTGYVDMCKAMKIYHKVEFDRFFIDDHVPNTYQDTEGGHREYGRLPTVIFRALKKRCPKVPDL